MGTKRKSANSDVLFNLVIGGTYFAATDHGVQTIKNYQVEVTMDQEMVDAGALSIFCKHLADDTIRAKHPDYIRFATHSIVKSTQSDGQPITDVRLMNRSQLIKHIDENDMPVDAELYPDDGQLQQACLDCEKDEDAFTYRQDKLREARGAQLRLQAKAKEMNRVPVVVGKGKTPDKAPAPAKDALGDL